MTKAKIYSEKDLSSASADDLLEIYNRAAERVNRQISRLKKASLTETIGMYDLTRAKRYNSQKARKQALSNSDKLIKDILALQERSANKLLNLDNKEVKKQNSLLIRDIRVMISGSHMGRNWEGFTAAQWEKAENITPAQREKLESLRKTLKSTADDTMFYQLLQAIQVTHFDEMPPINSANDLIKFTDDFLKKNGEQLSNLGYTDEEMLKALVEEQGRWW